MTKRRVFLLVAATCSGLVASAQAPPPTARLETRVQIPAAAAMTNSPQDPANHEAEPAPSWVNDLAPGELCGTHQRYMFELASRGIDVLEGVCPPMGACDDPVLRNASIPTPDTPVMTVRLSVHAFCRNNGSNCSATQQDMDAAMARLNADFEPYRIQFVYETEIINNNQYAPPRFDFNTDSGMMKHRYADSPETKLNIYVVYTGGPSWGTFPWSQYALDPNGGVVIDEQWFRANSPLPSILTHEVGHCLGLWHTHHGVDEVTPCGACYEAAGRSTAEGDVTGDLCSDTNPTPTNSNNCFDAAGVDCNGNPWGSTPYLNYMGYAHTCPIEFTPQQAGRMHCWTTSALSGWIVATDTTPPAAPTNLVATAGSGLVNLDWANNGESDLAGYHVYRSTTSGGPYSQINGATVASSQYGDASVTNGVTYSYVVTAVDTSGNESLPGNEVQATPQAGASGVSVAAIVVDTLNIGQGQKRGRATVTVVDHNGVPVANADVIGTFTGTLNGTESGTTNASGLAVILTTGSRKGSVAIEFCVDGIVNAPLPYDASANLETCDVN